MKKQKQNELGGYDIPHKHVGGFGQCPTCKHCGSDCTGDADYQEPARAANQPQHTPTPYHMEDYFIFDEYGTRIADCQCDGQKMSTARIAANAAFIVRACNNHDALVEIRDTLRKANGAVIGTEYSNKLLGQAIALAMKGVP